jgi:SAM-dependent methyltransferase
VTTASPSAPTAAERYLLGHDPAELERLDRQARLLAPMAERAFDAVGVAPGWTCLDVGCGTGAVTEQLAARVGRTGRVVALDAETAPAEAHLAPLVDAGLVDVAAGDVTGDVHLPQTTFDLVYARLLLFHLQDPVAALRRMWGWVRPGGWLVVQDFDLRTIALHPTDEAFEEAVVVIARAMTAAGCDVHIGSKLPLLLASAGLPAPEVTDASAPLVEFDVMRPLLGGTFASVLPAAGAAGLVSPQRAEALRRAVDALGREDYRVGLGPLLCSAAARKPAA